MKVLESMFFRSPSARFARGVRRIALIVLASALAGCLPDIDESASSVGDESLGSAGGTGASGGNSAPTISAPSQSSVVIGENLDFVPQVNDADGDLLTFSIENLPGWAEFDPTTGAVSGSPGEGDIGTYDITVTVWDGDATASIDFTIDVVAVAFGSATLSWSPPTENTDGSPLVDLAGYKVYWGTDDRDFSNSVTLDNPSITSYVVENLTPATWFFTATAFDVEGVESEFADSASKTIL